MSSREVIKLGNVYAFKCSGCGRVEPSEGAAPFRNEKEASIALQLHKIGCKKSR